MIETIIFSTDFSTLSQQAFDYTLALAGRVGARVVVTYAFQIQLPAYSAAIFAEEYEQELKQSALQHLSEFCGRAKPGNVQVEMRLASGSPAQALTGLARERGAPLVVVALHGRSVLERFFIGSTTEKILRTAQFPLLVVPAQGMRTVRWNPLACALDFSSSSRRALRFAVGLVKIHGGQLLVIHVLETGTGGGGRAGSYLRERLGALRQEAELELRKAIEAERAPAATVPVLGSGKPAPSILRAVEERQADLLVVGERGHGLLERMAIGSTTNAILRSSRVPVLVIPEGAAVPGESG